MEPRFLGFIAAAFLIHPAVAQVPECKTASLTEYLALDYERGCSVGGVVVFGFSLWIIPGGSNPISPDGILVKPSQQDAPRLQFDINIKAAAGEFLDTRFLFGVRARGGQSPPAGIGGRISGATAGGDGAVTVIGSVCPGTGGFFDSCFVFPDDNSQRHFVNFVAGGEVSRSGEVRVSANEVLGVSIDIGVDGGPAGTAALQSVIVVLGAGSDQQGTARPVQPQSPERARILAFRAR